MTENLLVVGIPRSGTTWLCEVLGQGSGYELVLEPDNEKTSWLARRLKRRLPRFPTLCAGQEEPAFQRLWDYAFYGHFARALSRGLSTGYLKLRRRSIERTIVAKERKAANGSSLASTAIPAETWWDRMLLSPRPGNRSIRRVVKSVHIPFCAEWVAQRARPARVAIVLRHPMAAIASMRRMAMDDAFREGSVASQLNERERQFVRCGSDACGNQQLRRISLQVAKMHQQLERAAERNPDWVVVRFETLCARPIDEFRGLFGRLGIPWSEGVESAIQARNRPGSGYQTRRIAREQIAGWKRELTSDETRSIEETFALAEFDYRAEY